MVAARWTHAGVTRDQDEIPFQQPCVHSSELFGPHAAEHINPRPRGMGNWAGSCHTRAAAPSKGNRAGSCHTRAAAPSKGNRVGTCRTRADAPRKGNRAGSCHICAVAPRATEATWHEGAHGPQPHARHTAPAHLLQCAGALEQLLAPRVCDVVLAHPAHQRVVLQRQADSSRQEHECVCGHSAGAHPGWRRCP